jgi:NADPH2:quinone reductase
MSDTIPAGLQLRSLMKSSGELELSLVSVETPAPAADQVVVRVEAAPINPSDLGLLLGPADLSQAKTGGGGEHSVFTAPISPAAVRALKARLDQSMAAGIEGAGRVVAAGDSPEAQALMGKLVGVAEGSMYSQYRTVKASACLVLPDDATAAQGASIYVNPLTALAMVEVMRAEGHTALVHTAAASNLGQMLNRICQAEGVGLVNIVRSPEQVQILKAAGAAHVCDSSAPDFLDALLAAVDATGATLAFDAIGGGKLAAQMLSAMETASNAKAAYSRYGSATHKQVYIYGSLDPSPTELNRTFGMAWGVAGWLLIPFLTKIGRAENTRLRARVAAELKTTFASHYSDEISLAQALDPKVVAVYARRATGQKFLINPWKA